MISKFAFRDPDLFIGEIGPSIAEAQIREIVPETFPGKKDFVVFYTTYNGLDFPKGALFYRHRFHDVTRGDYDRLEVGSFWFIPRFPGEKHHYLVSMIHYRENMARRWPYLRPLVDFYLPLAADASGNDFWIELETGQIKYRVLEDFETVDDLVDAAPSFFDFASNLEMLTMQPRPSPF